MYLIDHCAEGPLPFFQICAIELSDSTDELGGEDRIMDEKLVIHHVFD